MKYRKFGCTRLEVSDIAHGLWGMGGWSGSDDRESMAALQLAVDLGCNFFDSAWATGLRSLISAKQSRSLRAMARFDFLD